ncbi:hypothetical protein J6590_087326 [Homalodisca vitripennis]|nr:hypothetical protein J6590_087326 [Homalodisca vitripennis]
MGVTPVRRHGIDRPEGCLCDAKIGDGCHSTVRRHGIDRPEGCLRDVKVGDGCHSTVRRHGIDRLEGCLCDVKVGDGCHSTVRRHGIDRPEGGFCDVKIDDGCHSTAANGATAHPVMRSRSGGAIMPVSGFFPGSLALEPTTRPLRHRARPLCLALDCAPILHYLASDSTCTYARARSFLDYVSSTGPVVITD